MKSLKKRNLRRAIMKVLRSQGYDVKKSSFKIDKIDREKKRDVHTRAKMERISQQKDFILSNVKLIKQNLLDGAKIDIENITPRLIEVTPGSKWETIFRWWNLVWWSLPYERAYGRQIRYVVWDQFNKAPIGLIGLQSPILSWSVRDDYLGIPQKNTRFLG